jgi:pimeloyl-ACP methyl ester carboxylesterase
VKALGRDKAHVVGHDWGGYVAWHFAMWHPALLDRLALLNIPHPQRMVGALRTLRQLRKSWYVFFFQLPWLPERGVLKTLKTLLKYTPARRGAYDDESIRVTEEALKDPRGPVNYYRAALSGLRLPWETVRAKTLVIWGERDRWLGRELAEPDPRWVPDARVVRIPGASHWVQADEPGKVNEVLLDFLHS